MGFFISYLWRAGRKLDVVVFLSVLCHIVCYSVIIMCVSVAVFFSWKMRILSIIPFSFMWKTQIVCFTSLTSLVFDYCLRCHWKIFWGAKKKKGFCKHTVTFICTKPLHTWALQLKWAFSEKKHSLLMFTLECVSYLVLCFGQKAFVSYPTT